MIRAAIRSAFVKIAQTITPHPASDRDPFQSVLNVWKPEGTEPVVLLRWLMTEWCNYSCPYCVQTHDRRAPKGNGMTAHAFDNFPLEKWIEAFDRHFGKTRLSLVITGGEPFVDRKCLLPLLRHLIQMDTVECIRLDTNGWWSPTDYESLDKSKIILMCTFHPSQTPEDRFFAKVDALAEAGFRFGIVNYVMDAANFPMYALYRDKLAGKGIVLHPNPLWFDEGKYGPEELDLLRRELPEADFRYRTGTVSPFSKPCLFPALSYEMDYTGTIHVGCHSSRRGSFFDADLPRLPGAPVACPMSFCGCLDKYSFLQEVNRNVSLNPLATYRDLLASTRKFAMLGEGMMGEGKMGEGGESAPSNR